MLKKLLLLVVTGFFLASCAATNTQQGGDVDAASSSTSSGSDSSITAGTQEDLIVNVGDRVFFEFDSSELTVDAQATLDAQAAWLMQYPDTNRMEYISWGKERPEVVGSDETAYSQNRRGVTTVTN